MYWGFVRDAVELEMLQWLFEDCEPISGLVEKILRAWRFFRGAMVACWRIQKQAAI